MARTVTVGSVNIDMSVSASKLILQVRQAEQKYSAAIKSMIKVSKTLAKKTAGVLKVFKKWTAILGTLSAVGLAAFVKKSFEAQREMQRLSDQAGVSLAKFTQMSHVARSLGLQTEYLADGMKDLNARIIDAAKGGGTMVNFFTRVGQSAKDWANLAPEEQIAKFTAELDKMNSNEARFWADEINDSMFRLSTTVSRSGKSMKDFQDRAAELGSGTSAQFIGEINGMYESFYELKILWDEISSSTLGILATTIKNTFGSLVTSAEAALKKLGGGNLQQGILVAAKTFATVVLTAISKVAQGIQALLNSLPSSITGKGEDADTTKQDAKLTHELMKRRDLQAQIKEAKRGIYKGEEGAKDLYNDLNKLLDISVNKTRDLNKEKTQLTKEAKEFTFGDTISSSMGEAITVLENLDIKLAEVKKNADGVVVIDEGKILPEYEKIKGILDSLSGSDDSVTNKLAIQKKAIEAFIKDVSALKAAAKGADTPLLDTQLTTANAAGAKVDQAMAEQQLVIDEKLYQDKLAAFLKYSTDKQAMANAIDLEARNQLAKDFTDDLIDYETFKMATLELDKKYAKESRVIAMSEQQKTLEAQQAALGVLAQAAQMGAGLIGDVNEESSIGAKAAFLTFKAVAVAQAIVSAELAASKALAYSDSMTLAQSLASSAVVRGMGYVSAGIIAGTSLAGVFDDGTPMGGVPRDGTYMLEKGEMVMSKDNSKKFGDDMAMGGGGSTTINAPMNVSGNVTDQAWFQQQLVKNRKTIMNSVNKANKERPNNKKR